MNQRISAIFYAIAMLAASAAQPVEALAPLPLVRVADVPLPGNAARFDYQSIDTKKHLLFIAHLGDNAVVVFDTNHRKVVANIPNVSKVHGVLTIPQLNTAYASATGTNEVVAISEATLRIVARVPGGVYPDGMGFDPSNDKLFVSDEAGRTETVIDVKTNRRIATIPLGGEAGNTQYDFVSRRIFVNVQTLQQIVQIDPLTDSIVRRTSLAGSLCISNHGLLIDAKTRRAFVACEESATLLTVDVKTMKVRQEWTTGEDPDVLALDPEKHRLFVSAESGVVTIFSETAGRLTRTGQGLVAPRAHTVCVDPDTHLVYFPLENAGGQPFLRIMKAAR